MPKRIKTKAPELEDDEVKEIESSITASGRGPTRQRPRLTEPPTASAEELERNRPSAFEETLPRLRVRDNQPDPLLQAQLLEMDVHDTVEDLPHSFGRKFRHTTNTILTNRESMAHDLAYGATNASPPKIQIAQSLIPGITGTDAGLGVFVRPGQLIRQGQIVTEYGGEARWVTMKEVDEISMRSRYAFCFGPFNLRVSKDTNRLKKTKYYCVMDAADCEKNNLLCCGHVLNSCAPRLNTPYNQSNCVFGVDVSNLRLCFDTQPDIRIYVVAGRTIKGGHNLSQESELTLDYHWELAYSSGIWCEDEECYNCVHGLMQWAKDRYEILTALYTV